MCALGGGGGEFRAEVCSDFIAEHILQTFGIENHSQKNDLAM